MIGLKLKLWKMESVKVKFEGLQRTICLMIERYTPDYECKYVVESPKGSSRYKDLWTGKRKINSQIDEKLKLLIKY